MLSFEIDLFLHVAVKFNQCRRVFPLLLFGQDVLVCPAINKTTHLGFLPDPQSRHILERETEYVGDRDLR